MNDELDILGASYDPATSILRGDRPYTGDRLFFRPKATYTLGRRPDIGPMPLKPEFQSPNMRRYLEWDQPGAAADDKRNT